MRQVKGQPESPRGPVSVSEVLWSPTTSHRLLTTCLFFHRWNFESHIFQLIQSQTLQKCFFISSQVVSTNLTFNWSRRKPSSYSMEKVICYTTVCGRVLLVGGARSHSQVSEKHLQPHMKHALHLSVTSNPRSCGMTSPTITVHCTVRMCKR